MHLAWVRWNDLQVWAKGTDQQLVVSHLVIWGDLETPIFETAMMGTSRSQWCAHYMVPSLSIRCRSLVYILSKGTSDCQGHWVWFLEFRNDIRFHMESGYIIMVLFEFGIHCLQPCGACISRWFWFCLAGDTSASSVPVSLDPCLPPGLQPTRQSVLYIGYAHVRTYVGYHT